MPTHPNVTPAAPHVADLDPELQVIRLLGEIAHASQRSLEQRAVESAELVVSNGKRRSLLMRDWPVIGASRIIVGRDGLGVTQNLGIGASATLLPANEARLGLVIVASVAMTLYLCDTGTFNAGAPAASIPRIALPPNLFWYGLLGNVLWGGDIQVVCGAAAGTITVAEV